MYNAMLYGLLLVVSCRLRLRAGLWVVYCVRVSGLLLHDLCVAVEFCVLWVVGLMWLLVLFVIYCVVLSVLCVLC